VGSTVADGEPAGAANATDGEEDPCGWAIAPPEASVAATPSNIIPTIATDHTPLFHATIVFSVLRQRPSKNLRRPRRSARQIPVHRKATGGATRALHDESKASNY